MVTAPRAGGACRRETGRFFGILLLLVGFAIVLYAVPMITAFIIEGRLLNVFCKAPNGEIDQVDE